MASHSGDRESQGSSTEYAVAKAIRPGLTFRDSAGSSIASRGSNVGDRHDVVSTSDAFSRTFRCI